MGVGTATGVDCGTGSAPGATARGTDVGTSVGAGGGAEASAASGLAPGSGSGDGSSTRIGSQRTPARALAGISLTAPDVTGSVSRVPVAAIGSDANEGSPNASPRPTSDGPIADSKMVPPPLPVDPARSSSAVTPRETSDR